jgi:hypothetical protein
MLYPYSLPSASFSTIFVFLFSTCLFLTDFTEDMDIVPQQLQHLTQVAARVKARLDVNAANKAANQAKAAASQAQQQKKRKVDTEPEPES